MQKGTLPVWVELKKRFPQPLHALLTVSFPGCLPGKKQKQKHTKKTSGAVATGEASLRYFVRVCSGMQGRGRGEEVAGVDLHPTSSAPQGPALTWCPLPRSPAAGTFLLSGPGPAMRPGARRRARQASSSPRGGEAVWAVTMETAEAAPASEAAGRPAPRGGQSVAREPAPSKPDL